MANTKIGCSYSNPVEIKAKMDDYISVTIMDEITLHALISVYLCYLFKRPQNINILGPILLLQNVESEWSTFSTQA